MNYNSYELLTANGRVSSEREQGLILTAAHDSDVMLPPVVKLLALTIEFVAFTDTVSTGTPSSYATTWATYRQQSQNYRNIHVVLLDE